MAIGVLTIATSSLNQFRSSKLDTIIRKKRCYFEVLTDLREANPAHGPVAQVEPNLTRLHDERCQWAAGDRHEADGASNLATSAPYSAVLGFVLWCMLQMCASKWAETGSIVEASQVLT